MSQYVSSFDPIASGLTYQFIQLSSSISTSSTTYSTTGLELTVLETGTYMVLTNAYMKNSGGVGLDREGTVDLFVAGVQATGTESGAGCILSGVSLANNGFDATVGNMTVIPLTAGQLLQLRYKKISGGDSIYLTSRSLIIIKVA